jgi:hypothetical protein
MPNPPCCRCGDPADFNFQNRYLGIAPKDYCTECHAIDYPDHVEQAEIAMNIAAEAVRKRTT